MINFIPIFPLSIVVFPGETLNLHIFEPRYRQLIQECFAEQKPFGIPTVLQKGIADLGTLVEITEIVTVHEDGKMDIRTRGLKVFSILELIKSIPEKLYSGAIVNYPDNNMKHDLAFIRKVIASIRELHKFLNISKD
ncbi:MAG: LON peptidase substrate-binding domain-containing protein, partial [Sediminibacterium sp.]